MQKIALLGATGSIGQSAMDVIERYLDRFSVHTMVAGSRVDELVVAALRFQPERLVLADEAHYNELKEKALKAGLKAEIAAGKKAVIESASDSAVDTVLQAIVGEAGLAPSFSAAKAGKRILLANKESIVCGGTVLMKTIKECGATLLPVDSEHNAIFQCLEKADTEERKKAKIWLTCSGGPFRTKKDIDFEKVTPEIALAHPTWAMGKKISIDSATLMNKGFEVIEATHLFDIPPERIEVVVHPQSVVHSMVEFHDGSVIAQMGPTSMKFAIAHTLGYPQRLVGSDKRLDFKEMATLTFEAPDIKRFPLLGYAYESLNKGLDSCVTLNAANEVAVLSFLRKKISFAAIARVVRKLLDEASGESLLSLEAIEALDRCVREKAQRYIQSL